VLNIRFGQIETLRVSSETPAFAMRTPKAVSPMSATCPNARIRETEIEG
jgi:hypothetical protein